MTTIREPPRRGSRTGFTATASSEGAPVPVESASTPSAGQSSPTATGPGFVGTTTRRGAESGAGEMRLGPGNGGREPPGDSSIPEGDGASTSILCRQETKVGRSRDVPHFHLETDASLNHSRTLGPLVFAGGGIVVRGSDLSPVASYSAKIGYVASATHAEFETLLRGVAVAQRRHGATGIMARSDNLSLVRGVAGELTFHDPTLVAYVERVRVLATGLESFDLLWAPSTHRQARADGLPTADSLARKAAGLGGR